MDIKTSYDFFPPQHQLHVQENTNLSKISENTHTDYS